MTDKSQLCVEVRNQDIIVTMPGTSLRVVYRQPQKGPITRAEFTAKAMKLANAKARELGWIT
jgi:hypothetical protein